MVFRLKRSLAVLVAVIIPLLAASCSEVVKPIDGSGVAAPPKTTITFMSYWGGNSPYRDLVEETISDFMKANPDISVENGSLSSEDYLSKLKTNFVSGYIPDVFYLWPGHDINLLISAGQVADLKKVISYDYNWEMSFDSSAMEHNRVYLGIYGVPFETCFAGLYINKRIFDDYGLSIPKTYNNLKETVNVLNKNGIIPIAYSAEIDGSYIFQSIIGSLSELSTSLQYPIHKNMDPSYVEAMNIMKKLYVMNAFPRDCFTLNGYDQNKLFLTGKAAMVVEGSWFNGYIDQMKDPVELVAFPDMNTVNDDGYNLICGKGYGSFHISSRAFEDPKIQDACIRFLKYFTSPEVAARFINEKGIISALDLDDSAYESNPYAKEGLEIIRKANGLYKFPSELFGEDVFTDVFLNQFPYMLEDRITPETLYKQAVEQMPER